MEIPLLRDVTVIFSLSVLVILVFSKIRVPAIIGFLLTGIISGPYGLRLIHETHNVEVLAEIGIVLLLFTIGIEFSLENLLRIRKNVLIGGTAQVFFTILASLGIAKMLGFPFGQSVFIGFLISLSSTAIVLKILQDRVEIESPHGITVLGMLIFQDIIVIPMMLLTPMLSGTNGDSLSQPFYIVILKAVLVITLVIIGAKIVIPKLLYQVVKTKINELFLLSIVTICILTAWLTSSLGLSLALGAFIAGLIISESEYSHKAFSNILPFRDVFTSFFFVSIGMLLNISFFLKNFPIIILITLSIFAIKFFVGAFSTGLIGYPIRTVVLVGIAISQIGEFSFVLSGVGIQYNLLDKTIYQYFLSASILTMAITPFAIKASSKIADFILMLPLPEKWKINLYPIDQEKTEELKNHIVIVGFGLNGRNLAKVASATNIPYVIVEMNPETVIKEREKGEPIYYGDITQEFVYKYLSINTARVIVIGISDPTAMRKSIEIIRKFDKTVHLIVRTRFFSEVQDLYNLGADEVIPEEFETSVEIFTRVLNKYLVPRDEIENFICDIREDGYKMFRTLNKKVLTSSLGDLDTKLYIPNFEIVSFRLGEKSLFTGKTLEEIDLRKKYEITILAINRDIETIANPNGNTKLCKNDIVIVLAKSDKIPKLKKLFY